MVSVIQLFKLMDILPFFIRLGETHKPRRGKQIFETVLLTTVLLIPHKITSIHSFIAALQCCAVTSFIYCTVWYSWRNAGTYQISLSDFLKYDKAASYDREKTVIVYKAIIHLIFFFGCVTGVILYINPLSFGTWMWFVYNTVKIISSFQLTLLKHLLEERMQDVIEQVVMNDNVVSGFFYIRQLFNQNVHLNSFYGPLMFLEVITACIGILKYLAELWMWNGLKIIPSVSGFQGSLQAQSVLVGLHCLRLFLLVKSCSNIANQADKLKWELDRTACSLHRPLAWRKQMVTIIQEVNHQPLEITGMDFFTIDLLGLAGTVSLFMNYTLVFIQFM